MKVCYVTTRFPVPSETFACNDIRLLREAGLDVSVYTMRTPVPGTDALLQQRGLSDLHVSQGTRRAVFAGLLACVRRPLVLARLIVWIVVTNIVRPDQLLISLCLVPRSIGILDELERARPDIVHLFWGHYPSIVGYLVLTALPQSRLSMFLGAYDLTRAYRGSAWVLRRAHLVSTHARCNVTALAALGAPPEQIHVAYRGINWTMFDGSHARKVSKRIVAAGRLDVGKRMDRVLQAFARVHARWPDATLHVLGRGPEEQSLKRLAQTLGVAPAVTFLEHLQQTDVAREFAAADVFVHLSDEESERLPNVVKEAMASRCVCIVSDTPGITELVSDGQSGYIVRSDDVDTAAARIASVLAGTVDAAAIAAAGADHVRRHFSATESMRSYRERWAGLLGESGARTAVIDVPTSRPAPACAQPGVHR